MKNKSITIAALIIAIIGLSIGFAAFSNTLTIRSSASVNPTNTMNVVFSSLNNDVGTTPVAPTLNTSATGFTATSATINGDTLSNLNVSFTAPGQSVTYSTNLYVYNDGNYQAQLTGITFEDADGSEQGDENPWKHCTAITENVELANQATPSLVSAACNGINISVTIGTASNVTPASLDKTLNHQIIDVEGYLNASVTISYDGAYVDGPMSVAFGDIKIGATSAVNPALVVVPQQQEPVQEETNPWLTRGLTSPNVVYDKIYSLGNPEDLMNEIEIYTDGSIKLGSQTLDETEFSSFRVSVGTDYILLDFGFSYLALVFDNETEFKVYSNNTSVNYTKDAIVNNGSYNTYYVTQQS